MIDLRERRSAKWYSYRDLPEQAESMPDLMKEAAERQRRDGAQWFRFTIVSSDYPMPPYPDGLYVEGWSERPDGSWTEAPFSYPLVAGNGGTQ